MSDEFVFELKIIEILFAFDKIAFGGDDGDEGGLGLFDLGEYDRVDSVMQLVVDFNFLNFEFPITFLYLIILIPQSAHPVLFSKPDIPQVHQYNLFGLIVDNGNE
jgi:hypothetical protein